MLEFLEDKQFLVKKFDQSPFNMDNLGKDAMILCRMDGTPIAEINPNHRFNDYVPADGTIIPADRIKEMYFINKKNKHLVEGDSVIFRIGKNEFEGILQEIKYQEHDAWDWNDIFVIKNCHNSDPVFVPDAKCEPLNEVKRSAVEHKDYTIATIIPEYKIVS